MVSRPEEYRWSSYGSNGWGDDSWITQHWEYLQLASDKDERCRVYRDLFSVQLSDENLHLIRKAAHYCQPIGDDRFREQIESKYGLKLGQMSRGRPRKRINEDELYNK